MLFKKLSTNLKLLMEEQLINSSELARQTGLPASSIKKIRNNDNPNPTLATLLPLAKYFSVTLSQLVGEENFISQINTNNSEKYLNEIPIISWEEVIHWPQTYLQPHSNVLTEKAYSKYAFALIEESESKLRNGTILLFDPIIEPSHGDYIVVHKTNQNLPTVKQILWDEEFVYLKHRIDGFRVIPFTEDHKVIAVMMEFRKQVKNISLKELNLLRN